jgi:hypothetical protein
MEKELYEKTKKLTYTQFCIIISEFCSLYHTHVFEKTKASVYEKDNLLECLIGDMFLKGYRACLVIGFCILLKGDKLSVPLRITNKEFFDVLLSLFKYFHILGFPCDSGLDMLIAYRLNPENYPKTTFILEGAFEIGIDETFQFIKP